MGLFFKVDMMATWKDIELWWKVNNVLTCYYDYKSDCYVIIDKDHVMMMEVAVDNIYIVKRDIYNGSMNLPAESGYLMSDPGNC